MPLTLRSEKGSALTYDELDANFQGLANGAFLETTISGTYEFDQVNATIGINAPLIQATDITATTANTITVNTTTLNADVVNASGAIVQQKFARIGPNKLSIVSATPLKVIGLEIPITPLYADSIIEISVALNTSNTFVSSYGIFKNGVATVSTSGYTNSNEPDMQATVYNGNTASDRMVLMNVYHYETAGDTTARTYALYATSAWNGTLYTLDINNRGSNDMAGFSYMTVKEIRP